MTKKRLRTYTGKNKVYTDPQLVAELEEEYKRNPEYFQSKIDNIEIKESSEILKLTSGRGIENIKNWI